MSDLPGLALALAAQACLLTAWWWQTPDDRGDRRMTPDVLAASGRMIVLGGLIAGVAVGLRTQTLWLTAPLLTLVLVDRIGRGVAGAIMGAAMTFTIGGLVWGVPLLMASGGLQGYLSALGSQAGEDFAGGEMLYLNPGARPLAFALLHTFVDPWEWMPLGAIVLALAGLGGLSLLIRDRRSLAAVLAMAVPYTPSSISCSRTPRSPVMRSRSCRSWRGLRSRALPGCRRSRSCLSARRWRWRGSSPARRR